MPVGRRRTALGAAAAFVAVVGFVLVWFQPQKLVIDEQVEDATVEGDVVQLAGGTFVSLDHTTTGTVSVVAPAGARAGGERTVRIEDLDTSNGPDLFVYLTANRAGGDEGAFDDDYVNLGRLRGNQGDQNYAVPAGVDLDRFATVLIWCDRFNSAFGAADLVAG